MLVYVVLLFWILNGGFWCENELGFVWVGGAVHFFFTLALCLAITYPLDLQIERFYFMCNLDFLYNNSEKGSVIKFGPYGA